MSSMYSNIDDLQGTGGLEWSLEDHNLTNDGTSNFGYDELSDYSHYANGLSPSGSEQYYIDSTTGSAPAVGYLSHHAQEWIQQPGYSMAFSSTEAVNEASQLLQSFGSLPPQVHPLDKRGLQPQRPRSDGDLYTAPYIKGEGVERMGWCAFCSSWHKLKDSAYW